MNSDGIFSEMSRIRQLAMIRDSLRLETDDTAIINKELYLAAWELLNGWLGSVKWDWAYFLS